MKRNILLILCVFLCLVLWGCGPADVAEPVATPAETTPSPYAEHCGQWTDEYTGTAVWELRDDGTAKIPITEYNGNDRLGGFGTWSVSDGVITVHLDREYLLRIFTEDGFTKLWSEDLQQTFVPMEVQQEARALKYVDVSFDTENFWDYFALEQVPEPAYENGERIYRLMWVMRSRLYEEGLVYWDDSGVDVEFVYWTSYRLRAEHAPFGTNFNADSFNSMTAHGTITFVKAEYVSDYSYEDNVRTVKLASGEVRSDSFAGIRYEQYPY